MDEVLFSIITVCYNSEKTIADTIESVLNQTYDNYEYIIVDGKSTDRTLAIIRSYEKEFNGRLRVISEPDKGIYDAMNKGIRMAKGDVIGIINSDDWYEKDTLSMVRECYKAYPYTIYYGIMRTVDHENGKEIRCTIYNPEYISDAMINHPSTFVHRKVYEQYGMFDCEYKMSADYDFMIKMVRNPEVQFVSIYKILSNFRNNGVSSGIDATMEDMKIKRKYGMMTRVQYIAAMGYLWGRKIFKYNRL